MSDLTAGDKVKVTNRVNVAYGETVTLIRTGESGHGWYVRRENGDEMYLPFGWECQS